MHSFLWKEKFDFVEFFGAIASGKPSSYDL